METITIICVDDQREVLTAVVKDLAPLSDFVNIEECESAEEALDLADEIDSLGGHLALVISDHVMPNKTGVELLSELAADGRFSRTKKVLLTGQATHQDTIVAINQARIESYFEKPWNASVLLDTARRLVTEYIFDAGLDYQQWQAHLDMQVVLRRLH